MNAYLITRRRRTIGSCPMTACRTPSEALTLVGVRASSRTA